VCKSQQFYGTKPQFIEKGEISNLSEMQSGHSNHMSKFTGDPVKMHVSQSSACVNFAVVQPGDIVQIGATYNTTAHNLNLNTHTHGMSFMKEVENWWNGSPKFA
jgi:hypothetical protein